MAWLNGAPYVLMLEWDAMNKRSATDDKADITPCNPRGDGVMK